jgi:solute carrier family 25 carnitine/acylcarnitine transporter 20/29
MVKEIRNARGLSGFYRGYLPVLYMESVGRGFYMYTYFTCKPLFARTVYGDETRGESLSIRALSAAVAGCASWVIVYPVDVIKAKLQADVNKERFKGVADCIQKTFSDGGMRAFWRGIGFTLLRAAPTAATVLPVYEASKDFLVNNYDL